MKMPFFLTVAAMALVAVPVAAQTSSSTNSSTSTSGRDRFGQILGQIFGTGTTADASLEAQWAAGQTPLANQRAQFDMRIDTDVRGGMLASQTGMRLKDDYAELVALESRYGADRRFTTAERADLGDRYGALTQVLSDRSYDDSSTGNVTARAEVSEGRIAFNTRVDAALSARRITRTSATRLKADYASVASLESSYLRDGVLSEAERDDLDRRLDALDLRVGDVGYTAAVSFKTRLDAIARALPSSGLTSLARSQLLTEYGDLVRLEAAYARATPTADDRVYLERRLINLETRARVNR